VGNICPTGHERVNPITKQAMYVNVTLRIAALHTVSFVHGCFAGKCILTGSTEERYFKVDGSMEKKWDTVNPSGLEKTLCKWEIYVPLVAKGLKCLFILSV
jgi:hypothetical protein